MELQIADCRLQIGLPIADSTSAADRRAIGFLCVLCGFCVDRRIALAAAPAARASELSDDLAARRARVMDRLGPEAMLILWSAPTARYSNDVDYQYRQDSNLYYLTGVTQPDTMLVLMPGNDRGSREILFIKDRNPAQEHWNGRLLSADEARARTGIDTVLPSSQFEPFVTAMLDRPRPRKRSAPTQAARFFDALSAGRATRRARSRSGPRRHRSAHAATGVRAADSRSVRRLHRRPM